MHHSATYSPEDNKLRLYPAHRLDKETYERVKAAGFSWAPKQELFVAPSWSPEKEDLLLELCGDIGDEDTSLVDRAEERADRFEDLSSKRNRDAERAHAAVAAIAVHIPLGQPILVGHHSEKRARRDAERIHNGMRKAVSMWETSKYWADRASSAISHAKYKERPDVRARRIKKIESELRKCVKNKQSCEAALKLWTKPGLTEQQAKCIANFEHYYRKFPLSEYPRSATSSQYEGDMSLWSALDDEIITVEQAVAIIVPVNEWCIERNVRWIKHLENRLSYERAMLGAQGGTVTDRTRPEKGGACKCWVSRGWMEIQKVNKVTVSVLDNWGNGGKDFLRTVPFDKLSAVMTKADFDAYKAGVNAPEVQQDLEQAQAKAERAHATMRMKVVEEGDVFAKMKAAVEAGVRVVAAPQLFPTPADLARDLVERADIRDGMSVLEPSAGTGAIVTSMVRRGYSVMAVELNQWLADRLRDQFDGAATVICADFLELRDMGPFDRVVMNPPFANGSDVKHIRHALTTLKPGGRLVALCANGPRQQEQLKPLATEWIELPAGSFAEEGSNVNVALVVIDR